MSLAFTIISFFRQLKNHLQTHKQCSYRRRQNNGSHIQHNKNAIQRFPSLIEGFCFHECSVFRGDPADRLLPNGKPTATKIDHQFYPKHGIEFGLRSNVLSNIFLPHIGSQRCWPQSERHHKYPVQSKQNTSRITMKMKLKKLFSVFLVSLCSCRIDVGI